MIDGLMDWLKDGLIQERMTKNEIICQCSNICRLSFSSSVMNGLTNVDAYFEVMRLLHDVREWVDDWKSKLKNKWMRREKNKEEHDWIKEEAVEVFLISYLFQKTIHEWIDWMNKWMEKINGNKFEFPL